MVYSLQVEVQVVCFLKRRSQHMCHLVWNDVTILPVQERILWVVKVVMDAVEQRPLAVIWVPKGKECEVRVIKLKSMWSILSILTSIRP